ncbi:spore germination protein [Ectobacillus funiculus]|uniref:GerAB/ArcD/ProY family transporter n=1 Tax=Ectobacillus funiculus TaxID=137993 RepID=UPI00397ABF4D
MRVRKISPFQLFVLIFLFELGTAVVVGVGMSVQQDAWWMILLSMGMGLILFFMYTVLYHANNALPLTTYIPRILGPYIGYPLAILYILFFINTASRNVRDLMELIIISILPQSSIITVGVVIMILVVYAVFGGIKPLAMAGEIFFFIILLLGILGAFAIFFTEQAVQLKRFLPLFQIKWQDVANTLPITVNIPFGEAVVFTMLFPYLEQAKAVRKAGGAAILLAGLSLSFTVALEIATLGPYIASTSVFPLLSLSQQVNVLNFLQRLDAIAISVLIICVFFKITIFFYAAVIGAADTLKIKKRGYLIGILSLIILGNSILMAGNTVQHLDIGLRFFPIYVLTPMQIVFPFLLLIVTWIRKKQL